MKMTGVAIAIFFATAFACGTTEVRAGQPPLSCKMQMLLNGLVAMERDRGVARKDVSLANMPDPDLTKREIKTILDRVYGQGKNQTPDQIKDDVYWRCAGGR